MWEGGDRPYRNLFREDSHGAHYAVAILAQASFAISIFKHFYIRSPSGTMKYETTLLSKLVGTDDEAKGARAKMKAMTKREELSLQQSLKNYLKQNPDSDAPL